MTKHLPEEQTELVIQAAPTGNAAEPLAVVPLFAGLVVAAGAASALAAGGATGAGAATDGAGVTGAAIDGVGSAGVGRSGTFTGGASGAPCPEGAGVAGCAAGGVAWAVEKQATAKTVATNLRNGFMVIPSVIKVQAIALLKISRRILVYCNAVRQNCIVKNLQAKNAFLKQVPYTGSIKGVSTR